MGILRAFTLALQVFNEARDDEKWIAYAIMRAVAERYRIGAA